MVVRQLTADRADQVFAALADPTRRDILRRTSVQEHSVSALAQHYSTSFAAVQKHVAVLHRAELVTKRRAGREQLVHADVRTIREAREELEAFEALWVARLDRFGDVLADLTGADTGPADTKPATTPREKS
jgi:DNA-binding transcriptional ArsR family regulator